MHVNLEIIKRVGCIHVTKPHKYEPLRLPQSSRPTKPRTFKVREHNLLFCNQCFLWWIHPFHFNILQLKSNYLYHYSAPQCKQRVFFGYVSDREYANGNTCKRIFPMCLAHILSCSCSASKHHGLLSYNNSSFFM